VSRQDVYNETGGSYDQTRYGFSHMQAYRDLRNEWVVRLIATTFSKGRDLSVLDVGSGTGQTYSHVVKTFPDYRVFGVDFSLTMTKEAVAKVGDHPARIAIGNVFELPFRDGSFDVVYATRFIHQFDDKRRVLDEFLRVTKPTGLLIVEFYARPYHWLRYHLQRIREPRASFLSHFPPRREVRRLVGGRTKRVPLRMGGAKVVQRFIGTRGVRLVTAVGAVFPFSVLLDEYFLVFRK
jgi:ubiquinone/menaquinone biosynthesis C-methylase UbiE